jgi:hypothetical protein
VALKSFVTNIFSKFVFNSFLKKIGTLEAYGRVEKTVFSYGNNGHLGDSRGKGIYLAALGKKALILRLL